MLKLETLKLEYKVADYPSMLGIYSGKVRITLPIVDSTQQKIPYAGAWALNMYNLREEERSSQRQRATVRAIQTRRSLGVCARERSPRDPEREC